MRLRDRMKKVVNSGPMFIAFTVLMALYTNCSCSDSPHFESTQASFSAEGTGNGTNYDGKPEPGEYFRQLPSYDCAQTKKVYQVLSVGERDATLHTVSAETCEMSSKKIDLSSIEARIYNRDWIGYQEGAFEKAMAIPDPLEPGAKFLESWCRTSDSRPIDIVVRETIAGGSLAATVYSPDQPTYEVGLSRAQTDTKIEYSSAVLNLSVQRGTRDGEIVLNRQSDGRSERRPVSCRTAGWQDVQERFAPVFSLNLSAQVLPPEVNFGRASSATYVDSNFNLTKAAAGTPRFDYDPVTGTLKGLLLEGAANNLFTYSEQLDQPAYSNRGEINILRDSGLAPDGSTSAEALIADGNYGWHFLGQGVGVQDLSRPYTCSVFVKAQGFSKGLLKIEKAEFDFVRSDFDLGTSSTVARTSGTGAQPVVTITRLGQGWHRVSVSGVVDPAGGSGTVLCTLFLDQQMMTGDNTKGLLAWGFQLEQSRTMSSYIPADSAPATRAPDVLSVANVSWFNSAEGTLALGARRGPVVAGEVANAFELRQNDGGNYRLEYGPSAGLTAVLQPDLAGPSSNWSSSFSISSDSYRSSILGYGSGIAPALAVSGTVAHGPLDALSPLVPSSLQLGGSASGSSLSGALKAFVYWPARLPEATLLELSRPTP